jgi:hypothetical protein
MEGNLAPFLSMQKWGIEKSNVIYQDVVKPFMSGENRLPMLSYVLGSVMTGAAIQELNKLLTNRAPQEADIAETAAKATPKNVVAELATLLQLGSLAGVVGDGMKFASDIALKGKTPRNLVSFPAATTLADLQDKVTDYSEALQQGTDPWDATKMFALDMFTHNIQAARMLVNHTTNAGEVERSDKFRDLRVYRELEGAPAGEPTKSNKYLDTTAKGYKQSKDIGEAVEQLPVVLQKFQTLIGQSPEKAMRYLRSVRANNYQTMPAPQNSPAEFADYYSYLEKVKGGKGAAEVLEDYIKQNSVNRVKSSLIPSVN